MRESKHLAFHMPDRSHYYVYFMQSSSRRALYIGLTSNLEQRVWQHKNGRFGGFTDKYKAHRLVYFEEFSEVSHAITREKQLKGWRREKKEWLVRRENPEWRDLSVGWFERHQYQPQGPSTRAANPAVLARDDTAH